MKSINQTIKKIIKPLLKTQGITITELMLQWPHIVGTKWAQHSRPKKLIRIPQQVKHMDLKAREFIGVIHIDVDPFMALEMQYSQAKICEQINQFYGFSLIDRMVLYQKPINSHSKIPKKNKWQQPLVLSEDQKQKVDIELKKIENANLNSALKQFGHNLFIKNNIKGEN